MTREEKIELLNKLLEIEGKNDIGNLTRAERGEFQQWINDAIEQESCDKCVYSTKDDCCQYDDITEAIPPCEPCEDAISRQAVIKNQKIVYQEYCKTDNEKALMEELARLNNELPSVNPQEPKTGHWIKVTNGRGGHECDICHEYAPSYQDGDEYLTKYCPNCGVKMQEEEE